MSKIMDKIVRERVTEAIVRKNDVADTVELIHQLEDVIEQLRTDTTKIKKLIENILVSQVEGREFMTSSQLHEAVIQDCTAALNVGR